MPFLQKLIDFFNNNKKIVIINTGSVVVVLIVSIYFFIVPLNAKNTSLRATKTANEQVLASQQSILSKKGALKDKVERLRLAIPEDDPQLLKLGSNLQNLAVKNGMLVKTINFNTGNSKTVTKKSPERSIESDEVRENPSVAKQATVPSSTETQPKSSKGSQETVTATMQLAGSEESFKRFLQSIETNLRLIDLVSMTLPKKTSTTIDNTYMVELKTYYWVK